MFERLKAIVTGFRAGVRDGLTEKQSKPAFLEYVLPLPKTELGPRQTVTIKAVPIKKDFTARLLVIPSELAVSFMIHDIRVADVTQLKGKSSAMPAVMFTETSHNPLGFSTCPAGEEMSLIIENRTEEHQTFQGCFVGRVPWSPSDPRAC